MTDGDDRVGQVKQVDDLAERATLVFEEAERVFDRTTQPGVTEAQREEFICQHNRLRLEHEALSAMYLRLRLGATLQ